MPGALPVAVDPPLVGYQVNKCEPVSSDDYQMSIVGVNMSRGWVYPERGRYSYHVTYLYPKRTKLTK